MDSNGAKSSDGPTPSDATRPAGTSRDAAATAEPRTRRPTATTDRRPNARRKAAPLPRGRAGRWLRVALAVVLLLAGLAGIAAFRLSRGPISLTVFKGLIQTAVDADLGGNSFSMRDAELALGAGGLEIALTDVRISEPSGTALVQAPRAVVGLSGAAALRGQLAFSRLELVSPRLQFFYADDGTLSVKFAQPTEAAAAEPTTQPVASTGTAGATAGAPQEPAGTIDFVKALADISAQARRREHVTAYLREVGLRHLTVVVDNGHRKTIWRVPEVKIDLQHKASRSLIGGRAIIDSLTGPWALDFQTTEAADALRLVVQAKVSGANPRGLSRQILSLAAFEQLDVPLDGEARIEFSSKGVVSTATFDLEARDGQVLNRGGTRWLAKLQSATVKGGYEQASSKFTFSKASLSVDHNRLDLAGTVARAQAPTADGLPVWNFEFNSTGGTLAPATPDAQPVPIDRFSTRGQLIPEARRLLLQDIAIKAGGAVIAAKATVSDTTTAAGRSADLEARIAPMPISQLLPLWPSSILPEARTWLATHLVKGQINGGTFKIANVGENQLSLALDIADTEIAAVHGFPAFSIPRGLVRLEGGGLELTVPDAAIGADARRLLVKGLRFTVVEVGNGAPPTGEVAFRLLGPLATALELADRDPFRLLKARGITLGATEGKLDGQFRLTLPIRDDVQLTDIRAEGHLRLVDGRVRQALGANDITGAKFDVDISDSAIDGRGDFLLKGVPVKFSGQYFLNTTPDRQAPMRLSLKLDDADRVQLGLDVNDLVTGEVPVEVTVAPDAKGDYQARLDADLTRAELTLDSISFRKPTGAAARLQFDVARPAPGRTELRNFKIAGDSIAAEGSIVLGPDGKSREVSFPKFSLNTVSLLDVEGHLRPDHIWETHVTGATFDGRDVFRDLFNVQNQGKQVSKDKPGLDMTAEIGTVLGFNDTNLRSVRLKLSKRNDNGTEKTTSLDVSAVHETNKRFEAHIRGQRGERQLVATSEDAGQIFRAIGFYPNASGGDMNLEVALDGRGAIERNGTLKANNFSVLGDPVISEVFQNGDGHSSQGPRKKVTREKIDFSWMVLPFSVGCGQFVMNDMEIRGPLIGARMRGKADFNSQRLQIGGTYIPLSGLNSALGGLPVLGQLLAGEKGEGIFGFTFAIQGSMASPDVLINPLSGIVPGILRETQQLTPVSYKITPCSSHAAAPQRPDAARASSSGPTFSGASPAAAIPKNARPDVITDWSSDAKVSRQK